MLVLFHALNLPLNNLSLLLQSQKLRDSFLVLLDRVLLFTWVLLVLVIGDSYESHILFYIWVYLRQEGVEIEICFQICPVQ